ncbi:IPT/TIG domain-containing protein [Frankineae bacterium MT45]|nr:IPT/TIG domain-containing protein [Frankineae bacterium MT45]
MAAVITSFSPSTGPTAGGTAITVVGTSLNLVTTVLVGTTPAAITAQSSTSLTFVTPPQPAGTKTFFLVDETTPAMTPSATPITFSAGAALTPLSTTLATKWKLQVDSSSAQDGTGYILVRGMTDFQPGVDQQTQDDSDYDSGVWGSDVVTQLKWKNTCKLDRKVAAGYTEDPGQAILRAASATTGAPSVVRVRWYDRNGGPEAYEGYGIVTWSDDGGNTSAKSSVSVTIMGRGARATITNPGS